MQLIYKIFLINHILNKKNNDKKVVEINSCMYIILT